MFQTAAVAEADAQQRLKGVRQSVMSFSVTNPGGLCERSCPQPPPVGKDGIAFCA
jgi:hypothetical protein